MSDNDFVRKYVSKTFRPSYMVFTCVYMMRWCVIKMIKRGSTYRLYVIYDFPYILYKYRQDNHRLDIMFGIRVVI